MLDERNSNDPDMEKRNLDEQELYGNVRKEKRSVVNESRGGRHTQASYSNVPNGPGWESDVYRSRLAKRNQYLPETAENDPTTMDGLAKL